MWQTRDATRQREEANIEQGAGGDAGEMCRAFPGRRQVGSEGENMYDDEKAVIAAAGTRPYNETATRETNDSCVAERCDTTEADHVMINEDRQQWKEILTTKDCVCCIPKTASARAVRSPRHLG